MKIFKIFLLALTLLTASIAFGQSKQSLQKKRDALNKKISLTRVLIEETAQNKKATTTQIQLLDKQISFRNQLIMTFSDEIVEIEDEIILTEKNIQDLGEYENELKGEYKRMIYDAYKNRNSYDKIMYIFSSENFDQAFKRLKIMQQYDEVRKSQTNEITLTQAQLQASLLLMQERKNEKQNLIADKRIEFERLQENKKKKRDFVDGLSSKEKDLKKTINNQLAEKKRISRAIRKIIEAEANTGVFSLTPAGKIVSDNFEKNKGKLPWPVGRGVITEGFGKQPHKTLPGIYTENNGVDIATEKKQEVISVFQGKVTSVFTIPGAGNNVIVTHGAYKTVYSNLESIAVKKGDAIETGQKIGTVLTVDGKSILHMELWKMSSTGSAPINPAFWISN